MPIGCCHSGIANASPSRETVPLSLSAGEDIIQLRVGDTRIAEMIVRHETLLTTIHHFRSPMPLARPVALFTSLESRILERPLGDGMDHVGGGGVY